MKRFFLLFFFLMPVMAIAQPYTRQDTLRGSNGRGRSWWDVQRYDLNISIDTATRTISGSNEITFKVISEPTDSMQIDLQDGMELEPEYFHQTPYYHPREGNVYWIRTNKSKWKIGTTQTLVLNFKGKPREAKNAPWDGGFIWTKDSMGNAWVAVACQGLGASSWWPCKDYQGDEPDGGLKFWIDVANPYKIIINGRFLDGDTILLEDPITGETTRRWAWDVFSWKVRNPVNAYNTTFYIGDYAHYTDTFQGEKGILDLDFYPLKYNESRAHVQWTSQVKQMLRCYEYWLGPYPFYEDGYKLVEAPYLGMEHQSAIAYGNGYKNGYRGRDLSGTGVGFLFDYIIVHESGHEWFGNSITAQDIADNWLHEGFTTYTETLFAEWITTRDSAFKYAAGEWKSIDNDYPVIGDYGVNDDKGSDKYYKGAAVVHMIRMMLNDDQKFRQLLRGLNKDFYHKIVTSAEVEAYISRFLGKDLKPFFDVYLRSKEQPVLEWQLRKGIFQYRWVASAAGFSAPFVVKNKDAVQMINGLDAAFEKRNRLKKRSVKVEACGWYKIRKKRF